MLFKNAVKFNSEDDIMIWIEDCLNISIIFKNILHENKTHFVSVASHTK